MNNSRLNNKPHCLGQAASFAATCKTCKSCGSSTECAMKVLDRLETINQKLDVTDLMRVTQAFLDKKGIDRKHIIKTVAVEQRFAKSASVKFDVPEKAKELPVKAQKLVKAISKCGVDMNRDAKQGIVNFGARFRAKYMINVQKLLIETKDRKFSRDEIKEALIEDRELSDVALTNLASTVIRAMIFLNIIKRLDDKFLCLV